MRLKHRLLNKLSELTGFSKTDLCDLAATRKRPSYKRAMFLEETIGVHHDLWQGGTSEEIKMELNKLEI